MELKSKNIYFFLYFLLFTMFATTNASNKSLSKKKIVLKMKRRIHTFDKKKFSSLVLQAPNQKKTATINFNLRKSNSIKSLGLLNDHFALFSSNRTHLIHFPKRSIIDGRRIITNSINSVDKVRYGKVSQWRLVAQDFWNKNLTTNGWNFDLITKCNSAFLFGGKCVLQPKKEISKEYRNIPKHKFVRIEAFYHHIGKRNSNSGYLRLMDRKNKDKYLWTNFCKNKEKGKFNNFCGYETCKINVPISVTIPHKLKYLSIAFGADLNHDHPCEASYAISDVKIYVR